MTNRSDLTREWTRIMAPNTGDVRTELVGEAAEFLGIRIEDAWQRLQGAGERFRDEWTRTVTDPSDTATLVDFYNRSDTELFELIEWHAADAIHYRTLIVRDLAADRLRRGADPASVVRARHDRVRAEAGRSDGRYLDYGSGIGNDAMVFADAGFEVTIADISDLLLAFAGWRLRRRGFSVRAVDLKRERPPAATFDVITCFDVLEHIPRPLEAVRALHRSLRDDGLLIIHAPFGDDPEHPMHVVHKDVVTPRMRSFGFQPVDCPFPPFIHAPRVYRKRALPAVDRAAYYLYDKYLDNPMGALLAGFYRRTVRPLIGRNVRKAEWA
jgi:SAM-dependent methyltransferase